MPDFTPTSGSVVVGGNLTITNKMQKGTGVTVNSVEYKWDSDASYTTLAAPFNASNGQATVPAPPTGTGHTLTLRYNYSVGSVGKQVSVSHGPFTTVLNNLAVSVSASPSSGQSWPDDRLHGDGDGRLGEHDARVVLAGLPRRIRLVRLRKREREPRLHDFGHEDRDRSRDRRLIQAYGSTTVTITGGSGGGGENPTVNLGGPTTGVVNQSVTFTATASGGTPPYSYSWCWEACSLGGTFASGPATNSHTYTTTGPRTLSVQVRDAAGKSGTDTLTITINSTGGGGGGTSTSRSRARRAARRVSP